MTSKTVPFADADDSPPNANQGAVAGPSSDALCDPPPMYSDLPEATFPNAAPVDVEVPHMAGGLPSYTNLPAGQLVANPFDRIGSMSRDVQKKFDTRGVLSFMDPYLDENPEYLEEWTRHSALHPPLCKIRMQGSHSETYTEPGRSERSTKQIKDFDLQLDLTPYLYTDLGKLESWSTLRTVRNDEKAKRGNMFRSYAPGFSRRRRRGVRLEDEETGQNLIPDASAELGPSIKEWCHRYCASPGPLKTFSVRRKLHGLNEDYLTNRIEALIRNTGYRGKLTVSYPISNEQWTVYNDCQINEWRLTTWIRMACYFSLMFLLIWPFLFLKTRCFDVIVVDWYFSRKNPETELHEWASISEETLLNVWGPGIQRAALARRHGRLDHSDIAPPDPVIAAGGGVVCMVTGLVQATETQFGWGHSDY